MSSEPYYPGYICRSDFLISTPLMPAEVPSACSAGPSGENPMGKGGWVDPLASAIAVKDNVTGAI
jgi:hypothetical protein